jgi:hypothetical protein
MHSIGMKEGLTIGFHASTSIEAGMPEVDLYPQPRKLFNERLLGIEQKV